MNKNTLIFTFVFLATLTLGSALQCYVCAGSKSSDCAKGKTSAMSMKDCRAPQLPIFNYGLHSSLSTLRDGFPEVGGAQVFCLTVVAKDFSPKLVERSCGIFPSGADACKFIVQTGLFEDCKSCNGDKCNGGEVHEEDYHFVNQF